MGNQAVTQQTDMQTTTDIDIEVIGNAGVLTLNRPEVLNASSIPMLDAFSQILQRWSDDPSIKSVILTGTGEKAFCAGGDVPSAFRAKQDGYEDFLDQYFRKEYTLIYDIYKFPKPFVSLINGVCMGGGIGLSIYGKHRVLSEHVKMAMPETKIGFFTDIGGTFFLNRAPGYLGTMLALTGKTLGYQDSLFAGWGTDFVPYANFAELKARLVQASSADEVRAAIASMSQPIGRAPLEDFQLLIDTCFQYDRVEDILEALETNGSEQALMWLNELKVLSPISLKVELALLRRHLDMDLKDVIIREFRTCQRFMRGHDFFEGVRALLIDKDKTPKWSHSSVDKVTSEMVEEYFTPLMEKELVL